MKKQQKDEDQIHDELVAELLAALGRLEFICGQFEGTRRVWDGWGGEEVIERPETWRTQWVVNGLYLQSIAGFRETCSLWGYDVGSKLYRRWDFPVYIGWGVSVPSPKEWTGCFEDAQLVMTRECGEEESPMRLLQLEAKLVYEPMQEGTFTVTLHRRPLGRGETESYPGYYKASETLYRRQDDPVSG